MALSLASQRLSHLTIGTGSTIRRRLFPGDLPIGVTTPGRVVFAYLVCPFVKVAASMPRSTRFVRRRVEPSAHKYKIYIAKLRKFQFCALFLQNR